MSNNSVMNSRNVVCVIVHDKNTDTVASLLYGARSWSPQPVWTLPGGKAEPGEPSTKPPPANSRKRRAFSSTRPTFHSSTLFTSSRAETGLGSSCSSPSPPTHGLVN